MQHSVHPMRQAGTDLQPEAVPPQRLHLLARRLSALRRDRRGTAAVLIALSTSALFGMAALATEAGSWYLVRRNAQTAADAAAMASAISMANGAAASSIIAIGRDVASRNGFTDGGDGGRTSVLVSASANASPAQLSVTVQQTQQLLFAHALMQQPAVVRATAQAVAMNDPGGACVLALHMAVTFAGNSNVQAPNCGFASNVRDPNSFKFGSGGSDAGGSFTARLSSLVSMGGCLTCTTAQNLLKLTFTRNRPALYQARTANPYASLEAGLPSTVKVNTCSQTSKLDSDPDGSTISLPPGCYGSIRVTGGKTLQLSPGVYVISKGDFYVAGGTTVNCPTCSSSNGVTIIMTGSNGNAENTGALTIQANANVDLIARNTGTSGDLDGVLFYRDSRAANGTNNGSVPVSITGGPAVKLRGAIVAPSSSVLFTGSSSTSTDPSAATSCTVFVVGGMTFQGGSGLDTSGCSAIGTRLPTLRLIQLVNAG